MVSTSEASHSAPCAPSVWLTRRFFFRATWSQRVRLLPNTAGAFDNFGRSVAISGDTAVVGAPYDDEGGLTDSGAAYVFGLDLTAPTVTNTTPAEGASFAQGTTVLADYSCVDAAGGSGVASCVGTLANGAAIDTATAGAKSFTVTGTDNAGNVTVVTHDYTVIAPDTVGLVDPAQRQWHLRNSADVVTSFY